MDLRELIIERVRNRGGVQAPWVLDTFYYLYSLGVSPGEAADAMSAFVDEVIATKKRLQNERPTMEN